ncbi:hypothetical protein AOL_s00043g193 [Orbilia oligospora ATCC 24927]|uniref:Uncharacterized protein n=1 Tax=Arthrobotrys oligospora (strain ATCC 24927 / CBS 115.81 / DSM 1491) TaxID=756982 RepID=G1X3C0_ARTOA|nr:hypothetical protein AOL_s00043g193 [Orbilia oligospora ATCC 24927]EGX52404.1 hypothetical protein AOL_s00043g193 [Orbilia oligospora ATCC 24927]
MSGERINFPNEESGSREDDDANFMPEASNFNPMTELFDATAIQGFASVPKPELPNTSRIMTFSDDYWRAKTENWSGRFEMDHIIGIVTQELKIVLLENDDQRALAQTAFNQGKTMDDVLYDTLKLKLAQTEGLFDAQRLLVFDMLNATEPIPPEDGFKGPRWFYKQCLARAKRLKNQQMALDTLEPGVRGMAGTSSSGQ